MSNSCAWKGPTDKNQKYVSILGFVVVVRIRADSGIRSGLGASILLICHLVSPWNLLRKRMPGFSYLICYHWTCCVFGGLRWEISDVSMTQSGNYSHGLLEGKGVRDGGPPNHLLANWAKGSDLHRVSLLAWKTGTGNWVPVYWPL